MMPGGVGGGGGIAGHRHGLVWIGPEGFKTHACRNCRNAQPCVSLHPITMPVLVLVTLLYAHNKQQLLQKAAAGMQLSCNAHALLLLQDPVTGLPAMLVKLYNVTQQKEMEAELQLQKEALAR